MSECSVCSCEFSLDEEGGVSGEFGILPVAFCPTCLSCMCDMGSQLGGDADYIQELEEKIEQLQPNPMKL